MAPPAEPDPPADQTGTDPMRPAESSSQSADRGSRPPEQKQAASVEGGVRPILMAVKTFFTTIPGLLTGLAALITAVASILGISHGAGLGLPTTSSTVRDALPPGQSSDPPAQGDSQVSRISDPPAQGGWQASRTPDSRYHCDNPPTPLYQAQVQECILLALRTGGAWVQGLLIVSNEGPSTLVLDGHNEAWASNSGIEPFGYGDCGAGTFPPHSRLWCFTATSPELIRSGKTVWARGYVKDSQRTARALPTSRSVTIP
jgi:hypothetical protein